MILVKSQLRMVAAMLALLGAEARADVMEVSREGARWVAGPLAAAAARDAEVSAGLPVSEAITEAVPEAMVAYPQASAAQVPGRYAPKIHELAARYDLSPSLLEALVWQESRWRENAVSPAGARGLAQLMPGTARYLGVNPHDPHANLEGGARYLREQLNRFGGDLEKALAAYNAGPGRVERAGGIPNIRETQAYVAAIIGRLAGHMRAAAR
jgi:soluble lytic murein transglycosylase-like protein